MDLTRANICSKSVSHLWDTNVALIIFPTVIHVSEKGGIEWINNAIHFIENFNNLRTVEGIILFIHILFFIIYYYILQEQQY
jgi:hypothetical protein